MNNRPDSGSAAYLRGLGVSPGIAVATAVLYRSRVMSTPTHTIGVEDAESEWDRLDTAKAVTRRQLADLRAAASQPTEYHVHRSRIRKRYH